MLRRCGLRGVSSGGVHGCARRFCATRAHAGIFVDAENLQGFLKRGGASRLVEEAAEFGNPIVRRAYGNWNIHGMQALQGQLVTNGFHLVHVPYPVPKKSSADIAMVVDVMATQARGRGRVRVRVRVRQARGLG